LTGCHDALTLQGDPRGGLKRWAGFRTLDLLVGAIAMQLWGLRLDPQNEKRDFSHFTTDFVEF